MKVITLKTLFKGHLQSKNNFAGQDPADAGTNMTFNILFYVVNLSNQKVNINVVYFFDHLEIYQNLTTLHTHHSVPVAV